MLERTVETYLVDRVRCAGGDAYKFSSPARVSVPDRIVIFPPARIYFVELKRPGGKPSKGQLREHERLRALGCDVRVIDSREAVDAFVREAKAAPAPYLHVYEYPSPFGGVHREFEPLTWNGQRPARTVPLYVKPQTENIQDAKVCVDAYEAVRAPHAEVSGAQITQPASAPDMRDAYVGAREDLAIWKRRALAAEDLNRKFVASVNGPVFMGEPAAAPADVRPKPGLIASTKTINAVSAALDAVREYANGRVADQMNSAVNMLLDELGQARAAASQPAAAAGQEAVGGHCERTGGCVCGGDLPRVREGCSEWVKSEGAA